MYYGVAFLSLFMMSPCATHAHELRVRVGVDDIDNKYPYVVSLLKTTIRDCTGTLITADWVLTAAHCIGATHIKFGNMTLESNLREIKKAVSHPRTRIVRFEHYGIYNDLALLQIEPVHLNYYGSVSALNYRSLIGYPVEYAGFGSTTTYSGKEDIPIMNQDEVRPLQVGEGVVVPCDEKFLIEPSFCVVSKCSKNEQVTLGGDSGGPVFYGGKIVGALCGGEDKPAISAYTPVSPYLDWIHDTINHNEK